MNATNESMGQGVESALVIAVFVGIGWLIDRAVGTTPLVMILMVLVATVGLFAKLWYGYDARMRRLEAERGERSGAQHGAAP